MSLHHLVTTWKRRLRAMAEAEIPTRIPEGRLTETGSLLDNIEEDSASSSLSVALLQMGLIGHLPEAFPLQTRP